MKYILKLWNDFCQWRADYWFYNKFAGEERPRNKIIYWNKYNYWIDKKIWR